MQHCDCRCHCCTAAKAGDEDNNDHSMQGGKIATITEAKPRWGMMTTKAIAVARPRHGVNIATIFAVLKTWGVATAKAIAVPRPGQRNKDGPWRLHRQSPITAKAMYCHSKVHCVSDASARTFNGGMEAKSAHRCSAVRVRHANCGKHQSSIKTGHGGCIGIVAAVTRCRCA